MPGLDFSSEKPGQHFRLCPVFSLCFQAYDLTQRCILPITFTCSYPLAIFTIEWPALSVSPKDRADRALENVMVFVFAVLLASNYSKYPLSRISYTLIFLFLLMHEISAYYTCAEAPYDDSRENLSCYSLNHSPGFEQNHVDRLVFLGCAQGYGACKPWCPDCDDSNGTDQYQSRGFAGKWNESLAIKGKLHPAEDQTRRFPNQADRN
jgi:hypothetical protein